MVIPYRRFGQSVGNSHYALRNSPEAGSSQLLRGASLNSTVPVVPKEACKNQHVHLHSKSSRPSFKNAGINGGDRIRRFCAKNKSHGPTNCTVPSVQRHFLLSSPILPTMTLALKPASQPLLDKDAAVSKNNVHSAKPPFTVWTFSTGLRFLSTASLTGTNEWRINIEKHKESLVQRSGTGKCD